MTTGDLFGVAESTAHVIFTEVCKTVDGRASKSSP